MAKPELEFFDCDSLPWEPIRGALGQWERVLSSEPLTGSYTRLLRIDPETDTSPLGVQRHDFWEEVFILEGTFTDLRLGQSFGRGHYACRPPDMPHGPWRVGAAGIIIIETRTYVR